MRRTRELQEQLAAKTAEAESLSRRIEELNASVKEYQGREQQVVLALTEAQSSAQRLVRDARLQVQEIYDEADKKRDEAAEEAKRIVEEAEKKAAEILEAADGEAKRRTSDAEERARACERATAEFKEELARAAEDAHRQAARFEQYLTGRVPDAEETALEGKGLAALIKEPPKDLPDDYDNPSDLMHSIYRLQGRDIPVAENPDASADAAPEAAPEEDEAPLLTVDDVLTGGEAEQSGDSALGEDGVSSAQLDAIIKDVLGD